MMHHKVLIILAALFGIYQFFRVQHVFIRIILALQVTGIGLTFLPMGVVPGFVVFIIAGFMSIIYTSRKDMGMGKKTSILLITLPVVVANIFFLCRFPFTGILGFIMLVPIVTYIIVLATNARNYKNELGFLTILTLDATIKLLMSIEWRSFM